MGISITWEHFRRDLSPQEAVQLFKQSVGLVALSISSYCNRQCSYCPNSISDRKSKQNYMSDDLFFNIMRQLSKIDYSGEINITRYNEPLSDKEYVLSRLRDIRVFLPKAQIHIFTNGDYLDRPYLDDLARVGVDAITATVHAGPGGKTDIESLILEQDRRLSELGLPFEFGPQTLEDKCRFATAKHGKMLITYNAQDFYRSSKSGNAWAFDRGVLPIPRTYRRKEPCLVQFSEMSVEWDGTLLPCCQIQNDAFDHDNYVVGKLDGNSDLFAAWTSVSYIRWRIKMLSYEQKAAPCTTCSYGRLLGGDASALKQAVDLVQSTLAASRTTA